jgi:curved DNA-binding protein CbpA
MKSHYEILEIPQTASPQEIKRAYYTAVKKYPPEHNPKEFARIKASYDILRDPQRRLYHDSELEMDVFEFFGQKEAESLMDKGNTGRAIKKYEALLIDKPHNLVLMRGLAEAYEQRGFCNKAIEQYEKYLALYELDINTWSSYIHCLFANSFYDKARYALRKAVELNEKHELGNIDILLLAIAYFIDEDDEFTRRCFDMLHKLDLSKSVVENPAMVIIGLVLRHEAADFAEDALLIGRNIKPQDYGYEQIEKLHVMKEMADLEHSGDFDDVFAALFQSLIDGVNTPRERLELICMESHILSEKPHLMRKQIRIINYTYPRLFALHKKFFLSFLNEKNEEKMCVSNYSQAKSMLKQYPELKREFSMADDYDMETDEDEGIEIEPVRTEPKIGRNEPCPCGSGKKYKKCCGK